MNHQGIYLSVLGLFAIFLLTGCQPTDQPFIPAMSDEDPGLLKPFEEARGNVLAYVTSSSRVPAAPPDADWRWDTAEQAEGQHLFHSGDWQMIVWNADEHNEKRVVLMNTVEDVFWCGYVKSDGHVVDTSYSR